MKKKEKILNKIILFVKRGQVLDAYKLLKKTSKKITEEELWVKLGALCGSNGLSKYCLECCQHAIQCNPKYAQAYSYLGKAYVEMGDRNNAIAATHRAIELADKDPIVEFNSGFVFRVVEQYDTALPHFLSSLELVPDNALALAMAGSCYQATGDIKKAVIYFKKSLEHNSAMLDSIVGLGTYYLGIGDFSLAEGYYDRALAISPDLPVLLDYKVNILIMTGKKKEAYEILRRIIDLQKESAFTLNSYASLCSSYGSESEFVRLAENYLSRFNASNADKRLLGHALGRVYDKITKYDLAFEKYHAANKLFHGKYDVKSHIEYTDKIINFSTNKDSLVNKLTSDKTTNLIFIVGMPRSGTSLVEQMLSSHSSVFAAGELSYLNDVMMDASNKNGFNNDWVSYMESAGPDELKQLAHQYLSKVNELSHGAKIVTDKMPTNYVYLGLIQKLFPGAKILHCKRDPRDTCLSIYFQSFGARHPYSCDLDDTARIYMDYDRLMKCFVSQEFTMHDVVYEDIVEEFETNAREILHYCDLEWEASCLEFYKSKRSVATASNDQINKPIYKQSVARWKHYTEHLSSIETILAPIL